MTVRRTAAALVLALVAALGTGASGAPWPWRPRR